MYLPIAICSDTAQANLWFSKALLGNKYIIGDPAKTHAEHLFTGVDRQLVFIDSSCLFIK
jgi:hypothetical protein